MHDAALVREVECLQQLRHQRRDLAQVEVGAAIHEFAHACAFDEFHHDEGVGVVLAVFVDADDIGMQQPACGNRFVLEARHRLLDQIRIDQVLAYRLDRDDAFDARIESLVDDPHRALAEDALNVVFPDFCRVCHVGCAVSF